MPRFVPLSCLLAAAFVLACATTPDLTYVDDLDGGAGDGLTDGGGSVIPDARDASESLETGSDAGGACPSTDAGVGCCANVGRWCVGESCNHCDDCAGATCRAGESYCCPKMVGTSGVYKNTVCKSTPLCT
jgi:hypothetical protein